MRDCATKPFVEVELIDGTWLLRSHESMEELWENMSDEDEDKIPYWAEIWPAAIALSNRILRSKRVWGKRCLDIGCGQGLTTLAGVKAGAKVCGIDAIMRALYFVGENAVCNNLPLPWRVQTDWRHIAFRERSFSLIWGADILYELRFAEPICKMLDFVLAANGEIWLAQPRREVSKKIKEFLQERKWQIETVEETEVVYSRQKFFIETWRLFR